MAPSSAAVTPFPNTLRADPSTPSDELRCIQAALRAIEEAMACQPAAPVPFLGPTALQALDADVREAVIQAADRASREQPEQTAVHFCLNSAQSLLDVAQTLLTRPRHLSPQQREREWDALITHTKMAGRAAYRAALVLTDTKTAI